MKNKTNLTFLHHLNARKMKPMREIFSFQLCSNPHTPTKGTSTDMFVLCHSTDNFSEWEINLDL